MITIFEINNILQFLCIFLLSIGIFFILIETWCKFNRAFLYFGILTVLMCIFAGIDIWILPKIGSHEYIKEKVYILRFQHIIACLIIPFSYILFYNAFNLFNHFIIRFSIIISTLFILFFSSSLSISYNEMGIIFRHGYYYIFFPFCLTIFFHLFINLLFHYRQCSFEKIKIVQYHIFATALLFTFGIADIISLLFNIMIHFSFTIFGVLSYVAIITFAFSQWLSKLISDNIKFNEKLQNAYKNLEQASTLKQIGQSTAIINHEIKNYMFVINGAAQYLLMRNSLKEDDRVTLQSIIESSNKLIKFSKDILDLSKIEIIHDKDKKQINISPLIEQIVLHKFRHKKNNFTLHGTNIDHFIHADWEKLEHVFINMFTNSFEAHADLITVTIIEEKSILCITVDDNGNGCESKYLESIFNIKFTTKKGGTGIGLSIVRSVIEAHGGHISVYLKNFPEIKNHGLIFTITLPIFHTSLRDRPSTKHNIIVIKDTITNIKQLFLIFQNIQFNPYIIQSVSELDSLETKHPCAIMIGDVNMVSTINTQRYQRIYLLKQIQDTFYIVDNTSSYSPEILSEAYILKHFLKSD